MAFYIKVTKQVADKLGVAGIRNSTADGNVLLWQADVAGFPGDTVFDRAAVVGGVCLSPQQAKGEIDGVEDPVEVTTPPEYMDLPTESEEESKDESSRKDKTERPVYPVKMGVLHTSISSIRTTGECRSLQTMVKSRATT